MSNLVSIYLRCLLTIAIRPFVLETETYLYRLGLPNSNFTTLYEPFYLHHRCAQVVVYMAGTNKTTSMADLMDATSYLDQRILGRDLRPHDFTQAYGAISVALRNCGLESPSTLKLLKLIRGGSVSNVARTRQRRKDLFHPVVY